MSGFFEEFMGSYNPFDSAGYDEQVIMRNSLFAVVPKIAKNELTQMQRICFEMFYFEKKNQPTAPLLCERLIRLRLF